MTFSLKELAIINQLNYENYITSTYLSQKMFVTPKTIYRMVKKINEITKEKFGQELIISETGKGYKLNIFFLDKNIKEISGNLEKMTINIRVLKILFNHPKKIRIVELFKGEYLSQSSQNRQLKHMEEYLEKFKIHLRCVNSYVWIDGKENQIRKAIQWTLLTVNKNNISEKLGVEISKFDQKFVENQLSIIEDFYNSEVVYPYDVNIFTHIYMVIVRYRKGKVNFLTTQEPLTNAEKEIMQKNEAIFGLAEKIKINIENYLSIKLEEMESYFLFQNIYSISCLYKKFRRKDEILAMEYAERVVKKFFNLSEGIDKKYSELINDIYYHILPMLNRIRVGIYVENNMLQEIQLEYLETYKLVDRAVMLTQKELNVEGEITSSEIGFLTLYFEKYFSSNRKNILLICSTGIGTSELLKIKLQKAFPEFNIVSTMGLRQLKNSNFEILKDVDYIFSTINIKDTVIWKPIVTISPILADKDIAMIHHLVKGSEYR